MANVVRQAPSQSWADKNPYAEALYKRLRAYLKKKQRLERVQQQSEGSERDKLNADQMSLLKNKDQVFYPLKELEELSRQFSKLMEQETAEKQRQKELQQTEMLQRLERERMEGCEEGKARVQVLVKFLKHASITRHAPTRCMAYNVAVEKVLQMVYEADDTSLEVVEKLYVGSDTLIEESETITYRHMKEQMDQQEACSYTLGGSSVQQEAQIATTGYYSEQTTYDKVPCSEMRTAVDDKKLKTPYDRISFLNESEIDDAPPLIKDTLTANYPRGSMDALTDVLYNYYPVDNGVFLGHASHYHKVPNAPSVPMWKKSTGLDHHKTPQWNPEMHTPLPTQEDSVPENMARVDYNTREAPALAPASIPTSAPVAAPKSKGRGRGQGHGEHRGRGTSSYGRGKEYFGQSRRGKKGSFEKKESLDFNMSKKNTYDE